MLVAIHNVAAAEALVLAMKAGLDPHRTVEVISSGAGTSRMFEVRGPMMAANTYVPATMRSDIWKKDLTVIGAFASDLELSHPAVQHRVRALRRHSRHGQSRRRQRRGLRDAGDDGGDRAERLRLAAGRQMARPVSAQ